MSFILHILNVIPDELSPREPVFGILVGAFLFAALIILSISKLLQANVFNGVLVANIKVQGLQTWLRDSYQLNGGGSLLLILNYCISTSIMLYVLVQQNAFGFEIPILMIWLAPIIYLGWSLTSLFIVGILTGERQVVIDALTIKLVGSQLLGLLFFILATINALYHLENKVVLQIFLGAFVLESVVRYFKSFYCSYKQGAAWYYLILYFCTLEILPLFVVAYVLRGDFLT